MISTLVERAEKVTDRRFLVTAFLPTAVVVAVGAVQLWGFGEVRSTVARWADQGASRALFEVAAVVGGVFLLAYVVQALRWSIRAVFEGAWPPAVAPVREWAVYRALRKRFRLDDELAAVLAQLDALGCAKRSFADIREVEDPLSAEGEANEFLDDAEHRLTTVEGAAPSGRVKPNVLVELVEILHLLHASPDALSTSMRARLDGLTSAFAALVDGVDAPAALALEGARVRLEQRRVRLDELLETRYPQVERTQATQLGNVMARADGYSAARYDIPLGELWPRLQLCADEKALDDVDDALARVDFSLAMTSGGLVVALIGLGSLVHDGGFSAGAWIGLVGAAATASFYQLAVISAQDYGRRVGAVVDIYRRRVFPQLGIEAPRTAAKERQMWDRLHHFFARADGLGEVALLPPECPEQKEPDKEG